MLDVFRFAWFAVRTFFGIIALVLVMRGALWTLVKLHSAAMAHAKPAAVATSHVPASSTSIRDAATLEFEVAHTCTDAAAKCSSLRRRASLTSLPKTESINSRR